MRLLLAMLMAFTLAVEHARADEVDLALVLAADVSRSIDDVEFELQRQGYADAIVHPHVLRAIAGGKRGVIAVLLLEWSDADKQDVVVPWTVIRSEADAQAVRRMLLERPRANYGFTSISAGIDAAVQLLETSGPPAERRVIDVSGDGRNNRGRHIHDARDEAVAKGVVINGLAILNDRPNFNRPPDKELDAYYLDNVIGGDGAFMLAAADFEDFQRAILNKLILEISGLMPPRPSLAAAPPER